MKIFYLFLVLFLTTRFFALGKQETFGAILREIDSTKTEKQISDTAENKILDSGVLLDPLFMDNQQIFFSVFGVPNFESARLNPHLGLTLRYSFKITNEYYFRSLRKDKSSSSSKLSCRPLDCKEYLVFDYEKRENLISVRFGLFDWAELGLNYKHIYISRGDLDNFTDAFHESFGLKDGGRSNIPTYRFKLGYYRDGDLVYLQEKEFDSGFGDVLGTLSFRLYSSDDRSQNLALRLRYKFPTGEMKYFFGSGEPDYGGEFSYSGIFGAWGLHVVLGGIALGNFETFNPSGGDHQKGYVLYNYYALNFLISDFFSLKTSVHLNTPYYESELEGLRSNNIQVLLGGGFRFTKSLTGELGISEDSVTGASPDFSLFSNFRYEFF